MHISTMLSAFPKESPSEGSQTVTARAFATDFTNSAVEGEQMKPMWP